MRFAEPGETVVTLDDVERRLDPADVLIVDDVATAAIGGVMGAGTTEISDESTDVTAGGRGVGSRRGVPHAAAAAPGQRGGPALRTRGRSGDLGGRPGPCATLLAEIAGGTSSRR